MSTPTHPLDEQWTARERVLLLAMAVLAVTLGWLGRQPLMTTGGDDATYILLAQSLAQGHYRDLFLPGTPAHAQYPPGFPLMILAVRTIAAGSLEAVRIANLGLLLVTALVTGVMTRRLAGRAVGLAVTAVVLFNPLGQYLAGWLLSDTLFAALAITALALVPRRDDRGGPRWVLAVAAALAAFATRSVGLAVVGGILIGLLVERRPRRLVVAAVTLAVPIVAWFLYTSWAARHTLGWSYVNDLAYVQPSRVVELVHRTLTNARLYLAMTPARGFGLPGIKGMPLDTVAWMVLLSILAAVGLGKLWRPWPAAAGYVVAMVGILLLFPFTVPRLLYPLIPVLAVTLALGAAEVGGWLGMRHPSRAAIGMALVLAASGLVHDAKEAVHNSRCRAAEGDGCRSAGERAWITTAEWLRDRLPDSAVVASSKPSTLYLLSHHQGVPSRVLIGSPLEEVVAPRGPVTHIFLSGLWGYERGSLARRLAAICGRLRAIAQPEPGNLLLEVVDDGAPGTPACATLERFQGPLEDGAG